MGLPLIPKTGNTGQLTSLPEQTSKFTGKQPSKRPSSETTKDKCRRSWFVAHKTKPRSLRRHREIRDVKPGGMLLSLRRNIEP